MARLILLVTHPDDPEAWETLLHRAVLPAARALPGLLGLDLTRVTGAPLGEAPYYLMAVLRFAGIAELEAAVESEAGRAVREALRAAPGLATWMYGEEVDGDRAV